MPKSTFSLLKKIIFSGVFFAFLITVTAISAPVYASNTDVFYPANYVSVETDPVSISPTKNIPALFDGNTTNFALINYVNQPVGVTMEFDEPKNLSGFSATVGGYTGNARYNYWKVEAAASQADLASQSGSYVKLLDKYPTDGGTINITLPQNYQAKVFRVTSIRNNADGFVHWAELTPIVAPTLPSNNITKKVFLLTFDPSLSNGQTLSQYKNYNDPTFLATQAESWFRSITNNRINFTITQQQVVNGYVKKTDGFFYDETSYLNCLINTANCHSPNSADYYWIVNTYDLCGRLNRGEIDEVWMMGAPYDGFNESALAGPNGYGYNGPALTGTSCNKLMPIMGYNYERGLNEMIHDFGHRTEASMTQMYATWEENRTTTNWDKFGLVKAQSPNYSYSGCGSTHYPPNATADYQYTSTSFVDSNCEDFHNYPNLGDPNITKQSINCTAWGCTERGYYQYFFQHIPAVNSTNADGTTNDWWQYIMDPNRALYLEPVNSAYTNVSFNKPVTGTISMQGNISSITDSFIFPEGGLWNTNQSTLLPDTGVSNLVIDLQNTYHLNILRFQGNKNNTYKVEVSDDNATWADLATINPTGGTGERTRQVLLNTYGRYLKITAVNGGGPYSVSQVDVYSDMNQDLVAPTTTVVSPTNNATVSGTVSLTAAATDNVGVTKVEFYVDGALLATSSAAPYSASWNTTSYTHNSLHTLKTKAYDASGNIGTSSVINVTVADVIAPTASLTSPVNGSTVPKNKATTITATASDISGISKVEFYVDGALKSTDTTSPYSYSWAVPAKAGVKYSLMVKAYDAANNTSTSSVSVTSK
jgi:hypothetical protein